MNTFAVTHRVKCQQDVTEHLNRTSVIKGTIVNPHELFVESIHHDSSDISCCRCFSSTCTDCSSSILSCYKQKLNVPILHPLVISVLTKRELVSLWVFLMFLCSVTDDLCPPPDWMTTCTSEVERQLLIQRTKQLTV